MIFSTKQVQRLDPVGGGGCGGGVIWRYKGSRIRGQQEGAQDRRKY